MKRFFNTTGLCNPKDHYMVDPYRGLHEDIMRLVEAKQYFVVHAPRQTGKTTFLHQLAHRLNREGTYVSTVCSLESAGYPSIPVEDANEVFIRSLYQNAAVFLEGSDMPPDPYGYPRSAQLFKQYLSDWSRALDKPLVVLIDEVDALYDDVLISTLRQLRDGFQTRPKNFPQSIALVGLRDIREYRLRTRADNPSIGAGSPFNVKAESFFLPFFSREEVRGLLDQHTQDTGQVFSDEVFERLFHFSGGQPWLTNALGNGRTDLAVFWKEQVIPIELKLQHNARTLPEGIQQLSRYMDRLGQKAGYLVIFEKKNSHELPWEERLRWEHIPHEGREITLVVK